MASPGLLFLLMVSSSLLLSGLSAPSSSKQLQTHALQKRTGAKKGFVTAAAYSAKVINAVAPFMGLIEPSGTLISAILSLASVVLAEIGGLGEDATQALIRTEFSNLNIKIDQYHKEQKWDTWASAYAKYETKIDTKWDNFKNLVKDFEKKGNEKQWNKKIDEFITQYKPDTINEFANLLTKENAAFITDFGKLISDHVKCHEKDVKVLTQVINTLIYQGVTMSHFYYKRKEMNDEVDKLAKKAYEVSSTMFQIHKKCIIDSMKFVEEDVKNLIDNSDKSQQAKKIRGFLEKAYDRYDWTVVVFNTASSERSSFFTKAWKRHDLSGFIEVTKDTFTAAVSGQLKGKHTKGKTVSEDIKNCVKDSDQCMDVIEKLKKCNTITDRYSAVHVYTRKSKIHDSKVAKDAKDTYEGMSPEGPEAQTPYFYKGTCHLTSGGTTGRFLVFIKSDEEIEKKEPCSTMKCEKKGGKCVVLEKTLIPVCECNEFYYGELCEQSLDEYKKNMNEELPKSQSPGRKNSAP
ncbi:hypothetical protein EXN66_Car016335 [Scomber scombrus]|uniref:EGF-like domain-containing protein n=1 Tax=Scomber scombrus TaxID=13677 RepID=A0AAV1QCA9_SCOSC